MHTLDAEHHAASDDNFRFGYLVLTYSRWGSIRRNGRPFGDHFVTIYISCVWHSHDRNDGRDSRAFRHFDEHSAHKPPSEAYSLGVELEIGFNAMERLDFYATQLPSEAGSR